MGKTQQSQIQSVRGQDKFIYQISSQYLKEQLRKVWKTEVWQMDGLTTYGEQIKSPSSKQVANKQASRGLHNISLLLSGRYFQ